MAQSAKDQPSSSSQKNAKKINFPNDTKTSRLRAAKAATSSGSALGVTDKF